MNCGVLSLNLILDLLPTEAIMLRHPHYLEVPWDIHWRNEPTAPHRHLWWLIMMLVLAAMFMIGVGVTSGLM